jgi:ADP-heptose:LPS heptosyltransferase
VISFSTWIRTFIKAVPMIGRRCVLVQRHGGIGDVICLLPALARLRQRFPNRPIVLETSSACEPLVTRSASVDLVLPVANRARKWLHVLLGPYETLALSLPDEQSPPQPRVRRHLMQEFAHCLDVPGDRLSYPIISPDLAAQQSLRLALWGDRTFAVIHPGRTWPVKQWPEASWTDLVSRLRAFGLLVFQVGDSAALAGTIPLGNSLSLVQLHSMLCAARLFVGVDSGPLHIAAAARAPIVGLFGPTDAQCFLPDRANVLAATSSVQCQGCHHHVNGPQHWKDGCPHHVACMSTLSVDSVHGHCLALLA